MARYIRADRKQSGTYYWLVEAHRENGKVVQKRLKYLGRHEPVPEYNWGIKDIDDNVVYSEGRLECLYLVYHKGNNLQRDWHTKRLYSFYDVNKEYKWRWETRRRKRKKPIPVNWSSFRWESLYCDLYNLVYYDHIHSESIWLVKASHPATAISKAKRGQGTGIAPFILAEVFRRCSK